MAVSLVTRAHDFMKPYTFSRIPLLHHGEGMIKMITTSIADYSGSALLVTGNKSFETAPAYSYIVDEFSRRKFAINHCKIGREPSPAMIDEAVATFADHSPTVVVALGGGSVVDAAKAIAAMIPLREPVKDYLEGIGTRNHPGTRLPFIALPTTSGTGSEATRNAVLSEVGPQGFKRSLRHMNFVADIAILDPSLTLHCPPEVTAYSGMDAFTQLLESYLSTAANPITDALTWQGLKLISQSLVVAFRDGMNVQARSDMALAAYLSGVALANVGLGTVHGIAGVVGGLKNIPHGVICSRLMSPANAITVRRLRKTGNHDPALAKYASAGRLFSQESNRNNDYYIDAFLDLIHNWTSSMGIPTLLQYGVTDNDLRQFSRLGDNKNNPVQLNEEERYELLLQAWK
ncbi:MAG TPA: iron-containing alcohol dehydrogenase [Chryseolinea sp.]|nr:iron-containing alcohol dehydrogenase [Chryseolinea sp.]